MVYEIDKLCNIKNNGEFKVIIEGLHSYSERSGIYKYRAFNINTRKFTTVYSKNELELKYQINYSGLTKVKSDISIVTQYKARISREIFEVKNKIRNLIDVPYAKKGVAIEKIEEFKDANKKYNALRVLLTDANNLLANLQTEKELIAQAHNIALKEENIRFQDEMRRKKIALKEENIKKSLEKDMNENRILVKILKERFGVEWLVEIFEEVRQRINE